MKIYMLWILLTEALGGLVAFLSADDIKIYMDSISIIKPFLSPPAVIFPVVWALLYAVMGISAAKIYLSPLSSERTRSLRSFIHQLLFNASWSYIFFTRQEFLFAFIWLVVLIALVIVMIIDFKKVNKSAAYMNIPYLCWLIFAGYLNFMVWFLNK